MIRPALPADAPALGDILHDWLETTPWMPVIHTRAETQWFTGRLIDTAEVLVGGAPPAGFLARDGDEIRCLYLAEGERGQGLGKRLLDRVKEGRERLSLWTFQANTGARRFYAREGFTEIETTDGDGNNEKLPDVRLEWQR